MRHFHGHGFGRFYELVRRGRKFDQNVLWNDLRWDRGFEWGEMLCLRRCEISGDRYSKTNCEKQLKCDSFFKLIVWRLCLDVSYIFCMYFSNFLFTLFTNSPSSHISNETFDKYLPNLLSHNFLRSWIKFESLFPTSERAFSVANLLKVRNLHFQSLFEPSRVFNWELQLFSLSQHKVSQLNQVWLTRLLK